jgi:DNA-binding NarL/FixJ family response regulator
LRRILLVQSDTVLAAGVESLLRKEPGFCIRTCAVSDESLLESEIRHLHPDVVLMDNSLRLDNQSMWVAIFKDFPMLQILVLDVSSDQLQIYQKKDVILTSVSELIDIIRTL